MARYNYYDDEFSEYVSVTERRLKAEREAAKRGNTSPITIKGSQIAATFCGKAWCENLERYSDYAIRLPRGRTYVRSGCVIDLQIRPGTVKALVSGSRVYNIELKVAPIANPTWKAICHD